MSRYRSVLLFVVCLTLVACGPKSPGNTLDKPTGSLEDGEKLIEEGNFSGASKLFSQLVASEPENGKAYFYLGVAKQNLGSVDDAEQNYKLALSLDASLVEAHNNLGLLLLDKGDLTHAESELHTYLGQNPDEADAHYNYGMVMEAMGKLDKAKEEYEKSAELAPDDPAPLLNLGDMARRENDLEGALEMYKKAGAINKEDPLPVLSEGQTLLDLKRLDEAKVLLGGLSGNPESDAAILTSAGMLLARFDEDEAATALYTEAIKRDESFARAHILLANALARAGNFTEAVNHFEKFLELSPEAPEAGAARKGLEVCRSKAGN